jgi:O-antigen/teichoic acid export membrane protein
MSRVTRNVIYNGLGQGLSVILGFVAVRFVFRRLGGDALGLIYFSLGFSAALSMTVQLGICESAVREVAAHHRDRPEYIARLIRTSSLFYWTSYLVLAIIAFTAAPYLVHHWVKLGSLDALTATRIMRILSLGALLALPGGLYRALMAGLQHLGVTNAVDVSGKALQQAGIFLILLMHGSLFHVAYWIVVSMAVPVAVYLIVCARYFPAQALLLPGFSLEVVKENMGYASGLMTITLCGWALQEADKVIVSKLLPLAVLGIYTFCRSAIGLGGFVTAAISGALFPHFSSLHGAGKTGEMQRAYHKVQDLICFGTIPMFAVAPFAAIPVFSRLFDMRSAHMLLLPATFLCIAGYMNGALTTPYVYSLAVGRPDISARMASLALLVVLPSSALAIYFFRLSGAGFSAVVYQIFAYSYGAPRISRECLGMPARVWHWHIFRIMILAVGIYGSAWMVLVLLGSLSLLNLILAYGAASLLYCAIAYRMIGEDLRQSIWGYYSKWFQHEKYPADSRTGLEEGHLPGGS